jgi:hypothetical protein
LKIVEEVRCEELSRRRGREVFIAFLRVHFLSSCQVNAFFSEISVFFLSHTAKLDDLEVPEVNLS